MNSVRAPLSLARGIHKSSLLILVVACSGIVGAENFNAKATSGAACSSVPDQQNIRTMDDASDKIMKLRPVTFQYRRIEKDGSRPQQYGLVAAEVAKVMPELVVYNDKHRPETVRYEALVPLLLNELQKERKMLLDIRAELDNMKSDDN